MLTLYQRTDCPFCWKVRLALHELNLPYDSVESTLGQKHPEVVKLSPTGSVPVLVDDATVIWESAVIVEYLEQRYGRGGIIPDDPAGAARVRLLHAYSDKLVGQCLRDIVFEKRSRLPADRDEAKIRSGREAWRLCQDYLEQQLGNGPWFGTANYSAADCALAARFGVAEAYDEGVTADLPRLHRWYAALRNRPNWASAYPASFIGQR